MRYLLDTHTFLWAVSATDKLSRLSRALIEDLDNEIYLSTASLWEIAIKVSIGKIRLTSSYGAFITHQLAINDFIILSASLQHYEEVASLPQHHKDPFDRLIIAQSQVEQIPVISIDESLDLYRIQRLW